MFDYHPLNQPPLVPQQHVRRRAVHKSPGPPRKYPLPLSPQLFFLFRHPSHPTTTTNATTDSVSFQYKSVKNPWFKDNNEVEDNNVVLLRPWPFDLPVPAPLSPPSSLLSRGPRLGETHMVDSPWLLGQPWHASPLLHYCLFLWTLLFTWTCYLLLPKGCRKAYCGTSNRRMFRTHSTGAPRYRPYADTVTRPVDLSIPRVHRHQSTVAMPQSQEEPIPITSILSWKDDEDDDDDDDEFISDESIRTSDLIVEPRDSVWRPRSTPSTPQRSRETSFSTLSSAVSWSPNSLRLAAPPKIQRHHWPVDDPSSTLSHMESVAPHETAVPDDLTKGNFLAAALAFGSFPEKIDTPGPTSPSAQRVVTAPHQPSFAHPAISVLPDRAILSQTMSRLRCRGLRVMAHGLHCDPKRIWIKFDAETTSLSWQTEFPRVVLNQSGETSTVLIRGGPHTIALPNIVYVDVGQQTAALQRVVTTVPAQYCCSLLTAAGSLDLQANSQLERDAFVACVSFLLDQVHAGDWRQWYQHHPEPWRESSTVNGSSILTAQDDNDNEEVSSSDDTATASGMGTTDAQMDVGSSLMSDSTATSRDIFDVASL